MKTLLFLIFSFFLLRAQAQDSSRHRLRVLFLGNSYTYVNDLPQLTSAIASSMGDTLDVVSNTPGGYTLKNHFNDKGSTMLIQSGGFDKVVLQAQSQEPSFPDWQIETDLLPYAKALADMVHDANKCAEVVFYMTWGRKNGDYFNCPNLPVLCTYLGMDSLLQLRYRMMADDNHGTISPVAAVWRNLRNNYPDIDLYQSDESHPSAYGSYAAACSFYTVFFHRNPSSIRYDFTLDAATAAIIRAAVKQVVFDSLRYWNVDKDAPVAKFSYVKASDHIVKFTNESLRSESYTWQFGDGENSNDENPTHSFIAPGIYEVRLTASYCSGSSSDSLSIEIKSNQQTPVDTVQPAPPGIVVPPQKPGDTVKVQLPAIVNAPMDSTIRGSFQSPQKLFRLYSPLLSKKFYRVFIINTLGQIVYNASTIAATEQYIDCHSFPHGLFVLSLMDNNAIIFQQKFISQ